MKMNVKFSINMDCEIDKSIADAVSEQHLALIDAVMSAVNDGKLNHSQIDIDDGDICLMARIVV